MRRCHVYLLCLICGLAVVTAGYFAWRTQAAREIPISSRSQTSLSDSELARLCKLVEQGNLDGVRDLLERGADPNHRYTYTWATGDVFGETELPLIALAAREGRSNLVELLGEYGANTENLCSNEPGDRGTTALGLAAFSGEKESVVLLIGLGADIEPKVEWDARPLFLALFGQRTVRFIRWLRHGLAHRLLYRDSLAELAMQGHFFGYPCQLGTLCSAK